MVLSGRTHVWPFNVAAPNPSALVPVGPVHPAQHPQHPVGQPQQSKKQSLRGCTPLKVFRLMSLPLELVHAVLSYLEPPDLLALSCTSRIFANLLRRPGDRRALKVWTQARLNMEVPELRSDLREGGDDVAAEVLLARLIGGETCQVCGGEARHADLYSRTRVCMTCRSSLFMTADQLSQTHGQLHPWTVECALNTLDVNAQVSVCFVPDALALSAILTSITAQALGTGVEPGAAVQTYVSQRVALRARVRWDARVLQVWNERRAERAAREREGRVALRHEQMFNKLAALGLDKDTYDHDYLCDELAKALHEPPVWYDGASARQERERRNNELKDFCTSDAPLDDDEWDVYKDRIVAWVEQNRRDCRERYKNWEQTGKRDDLKPLYAFVQRCVDEETAPFLLPLSSFLRLPSPRTEWEWLGYVNGETCKDQLCRLLPFALADALEAVRTDRLVLVDRIARILLADGDPLPSSMLLALSASPSPFIDRDPHLGVEPAYAAISPADAGNLLERAVALFRCGVCGLLAPFAQLVPHVHASHGVRAPPRCLVAPAQVRALVRSAAGATATVEACEKLGRVWEISGGGGVVEGGVGPGGDGGAAARPWKLKGQTWAEVMQHNFFGVTGLKVGRTLRRSTLEGPGAPPAPPTPSPSGEREKVRLLGFDAGEHTESAWAWV